MERRLAVALVVAALASAAFLALAPLSSSTTCDTSGCFSDSRSLLEHEGATLLLVLAAPVVAALLAAAVPSRPLRFAVAVGLLVLAVLGMASIGLFLLPVVGLAWLLAYSTSARSAAK